MYFLPMFKFFVLLGLVHWTTQRAAQHQNHHSTLKISGCNRQRSTFQVDVFVTVSSLSLVTKNGNTISRQIEVNWHGPKPRQGDQVALFSSDPTTPKNPLSSLKPIVKVNASDYPSGYFQTNTEFPFIYFNLTTLAQHPCLGYWAAYISKGIIHTSSCLQIRPFWMQENKKYLQDQKLSDVMIPGSHDSGCFTPFLGKSTDILMIYKYAQEEPIFNQLAYGLRYFDFRVGYYPKTSEKYFINHSFFRTDHSLQAILSQVRSFLIATKEIVILDFHLFPVGFDDIKVHLNLMKLIYDQLNPYLIPHNSSFVQATFRELWNKDKRVLVSYNHKARKIEPHGVLWPGLPRAWGNKQHPEDLKLYFEKVFSKPSPKGLWCSMAELTPNSRFILTHPKTGLRSMANEINRNVTRWFRDQFWEKANIVATDFFLGNNLIDVAIETNRMKSFCSRSRLNNHHG